MAPKSVNSFPIRSIPSPFIRDKIMEPRQDACTPINSRGIGVEATPLIANEASLPHTGVEVELIKEETRAFLNGLFTK